MTAGLHGELDLPRGSNAIDVAYRAVYHIHFEGMQFRRDIGRKALGWMVGGG